VNPDEARRRRAENTVRLGKAKKEEHVNKRRMALLDDDEEEEGSSSMAATTTATAGNAITKGKVFTVHDIPRLIELIRSNDEALMFEAVSAFRKMLSKEDAPPIDQVIEAGLVEVFVRFLSSPNPKMVFEASWALTNIASGSSAHTAKVVESGAIPIFVQLLNHHDADVKEQAVWVIGNITGDSPHCRDIILASGALPTVLRNINHEARLSFVRNATWTISNCLRGKPAPPAEMVAQALPMLAELIYSEDTGES
jgi:importin subunit alpha-6/7